MRHRTETRHCINCILAGYCVRLTTKAVTKSEMTNLDFVNDAFFHAHSLNLAPSEWRSFLSEHYTEYRGRVIGRDGNEEYLNMDLFEVDDEAFAGSTRELSNAHERVRNWFEYYLCGAFEPRDNTNFNKDTYEKLRIVFTILRLAYPEKAQFWGLKGKAANDNDPA